MNDASVIVSQNNRAVKQAEIDKLKAAGRVVVVKRRLGIDDIESYTTYDSIQEARLAVSTNERYEA